MRFGLAYMGLLFVSGCGVVETIATESDAGARPSSSSGSTALTESFSSESRPDMSTTNQTGATTLPTARATDTSGGDSTDQTTSSLPLSCTTAAYDGGADAFSVDAGVAASFAFIVDGEAKSPMTCPSMAWVFHTPVGKPSSVVIKNTGNLPLAYVVQELWNVGSGDYAPGVCNPGPHIIAGVLPPDGSVDITYIVDLYLPSNPSDYVALLGSAAPFGPAATESLYQDQGSIPWPHGLPGSGGATTMHVAQVDINTSCARFTPLW